LQWLLQPADELTAVTAVVRLQLLVLLPMLVWVTFCALLN
jgi:hypothetical protein